MCGLASGEGGCKKKNRKGKEMRGHSIWPWRFRTSGGKLKSCKVISNEASIDGGSMF